MNAKQLKALLRENGIVGAGGAGFPTYAKLDPRADTLILNCAECEPLLRLHRQVLETYTYEILSTLDLISKILEVPNVLIGIKGSYKRTLAAVKGELTSFPNIKIATLPEIYPAGDEVVLTYEATGRVVPAGSIPLEVGVAVLNVETVYNIHRAMEGQPVTHKFVTVTGEVKKPITIYAPLGLSMAELIKLAGGATIEDPALLMGGPMMGKLVELSDVVTKTTNGLLVLPQSLPLIQKKLSKPTIDVRRAMASCCQCNYCTSLCPRNLLGHPIDPAAFMLNAAHKATNQATAYLNAAYCCGCGLCELFSCTQNLNPRSLLQATKESLAKEGIKPKKPAMKEVHPHRELRRIPLSRLRARLGLDPYNMSAPMDEKPIKAKRLKIALSQHIGAPAIPCVQKGDLVEAGQLIAAPAENALSVAIHAPMSGKILEAGKTRIIITT